MSTKADRVRYVNLIAPTHNRKSCKKGGEFGCNNAAYDEDDCMGQGGCYRCTLMRAAVHGLTEEDKREYYDL